MATRPTIDIEARLSRGAKRSRIEYWAIPGALTADQAVVAFEGGLPDPVTFPREELIALHEQVLRRDGELALQYSSGRYDIGYGYSGLREVLGARAGAEDGRSVEPEGVLLTSGAAQAISLTIAAFVDPGDAVIVEAPTWHFTLREIALVGARAVGIPVDADGMRVDLLEAHLKELRAEGVRPKLIYTIANFNMPTGFTLSIERRQRLLAIAQEWGLVVLEDDAYGDLRYEGERVPSLFSMDDSGLVLKVKSFSKVLAPALRVGWVLGYPDTVAALVRSRRDLGVSALTSRVLAEYVMGGQLDRHVAEIIPFYRSKQDTLVTGLAENCAPLLTWTRPKGSFFFWLDLADGLDPKRVWERLRAHGVACRPGTAFFTDGTGERNLRLCFSLLSPEAIEEGTALLGRALGESQE